MPDYALTTVRRGRVSGWKFVDHLRDLFQDDRQRLLHVGEGGWWRETDEGRSGVDRTGAPVRGAG